MIYNFDNPGVNHADKLAILDADQVLVDLLTEMDRYMLTEYGPSLGLTGSLELRPRHYDLDVRYPWVEPGTSKSYIAAFAAAGGYRRTAFLPGAQEAVAMLDGAGWHVEIVSGVPPDWLEDRYSVLRRLGLFRQQLHLTGLQQPKTEKIQSLIHRHRPSRAIVVDDLPEHLNAAVGLAECVLIQNHYVDREHPGEHVVIHNSLLEYVTSMLAVGKE